MAGRMSCRWISKLPPFGEGLREEFVSRIKHGHPLKHARFNANPAPRSEGNSAVLVPLLNINSEPYILFTQRALFLTFHRGQICFPGGRLDPDETPEQGALRETREEIGLDVSKVDIWGQLRPVYTRDLINTVTPIVGMLHNVDLATLQARCEEVQSVFAVPLEEVLSSNRYTHFRRGKAEYILPVFISRHFHMISSGVPAPEEYRIWGLTAGILHVALLNLFPSLYKSNIQIIHPPGSQISRRR